MSILVTLGNINLATFENVCFAVERLYPNDVDTILVFDTPESTADGLESARNQVVRSVFPKVEIRSRVVTRSDLQTAVPLALADVLEEFGVSDVIIDLTNGQKAETGVLYAVATISRIGRIHSLHIKQRENLSKRIPDLRPDEWEYAKLEPLRDIDQVAKRCYLELLYYRERIEQVADAIGKHNPSYAHRTTRLLVQALEDYFHAQKDRDRYSRAIATLGIVCEELAQLLFQYCRQSKQIEADVKGFAPQVQQIGAILERLRKKGVDWEAEGHFGQQMQRILFHDRLLAVTVVFRNVVDHPTPYICSEDEARLVLDTALLMLKRLGETDVFGRV